MREKCEAILWGYTYIYRERVRVHLVSHEGGGGGGFNPTFFNN